MITRRKLLKSGAAFAAAASSSGLALPAFAQTKTLKIGYVSPQTGPLSAFSAADSFMVEKFLAAAPGLGLDVEVIVKDSQSNPNRAAEVAKELISRDEVNLILVASTPETTNPVCSIAEQEEIPVISTVAPWQPYFFGRNGAPETGFNYTYHFFWGLEDVIGNFTNGWNSVKTNKKVGGLFPNDGDGNAWGDKELGFPKPLSAMGYTLTDPGRFQDRKSVV